MPDISLIRSHSLPVAEAKARVQKSADELASEHDLSSEWEGNTLRFHRPGLEGEICVSRSEIRLEANLGFLMKPLKRMLVDEIERTFDRVFAEPKSGEQTRKPAKKIAPASG